jgi:hypothetical protein
MSNREIDIGVQCSDKFPLGYLRIGVLASDIVLQGMSAKPAIDWAN